MHDTPPVHIPVAHLMSERNIDGDNGQGRTKDSRFGPYQSVVEFFAWFWATWQKAKGGTKEAYEFDDNISKQLCICSCSDRGANAGQHFPAPY